MTATSDMADATIAVIRARWHSEIVDHCVHSFINEWVKLGGRRTDIDVFDVPGALEIPLHAQALIRTKRYTAVIGTAFIVDGGIYRHDFVARTVLDAMMRVSLDSGVPILSTVLTPHNFQESKTHISFFKKHFVQKGREAAIATRELLNVRAQLGLTQT